MNALIRVKELINDFFIEMTFTCIIHKGDKTNCLNITYYSRF